jgi:hypothetical protein
VDGAAGGTLGGSGTINGTLSVQNGGAIQPSSSGSSNTLTLASSTAPTFNTGSKLYVRVPTTAGADKLYLSSSTPAFNANNLNLTIDPTGLSGNVTGATIVQVARTSSGIVGAFASTNVIGANYTATVHYNAQTITVDLLATAPTITTSGALSAVNTTYGSASPSPASFTVSGANMAAGITVTPPAGFEVSQTSISSGYAGSGSAIAVGSSGTISATTIYVRLAATAPVSGSPYSGNIVCSSSGAAGVNLATASSTVRPLPVQLSGSKTYDGATTINAANLSIADKVGSDDVTLGGSATLAAAAVGSQSISSVSGLSLSGSAAVNYTLSGYSGSVTVSKATPTVTVTVGTYTYSGSSQGPSAYTTNPGGDTGSAT